jgi:hypothetical protein
MMRFARVSRVIAALAGRPDSSGLAWPGERKVRTPQGSVLANGEGRKGISDPSGRTLPARKVPQKIYRSDELRSKGEKVRPRFVGD